MRRVGIGLENLLISSHAGNVWRREVRLDDLLTCFDHIGGIGIELIGLVEMRYLMILQRSEHEDVEL